MLSAKKLFLSALILSIFGLSSLAPVSQASNYSDQMVGEMITATNLERTALGLEPLKVDATLNQVAELKVQDMVKNGYFAHISPAGVSPWHWFAVAGYDYRYAGENLAVNFTDYKNILPSWMKSPSHKANIVDPHYTAVGMATMEGVYKGKTVVFVAQEFGKPQLVNSVDKSAN
ncbi:MAG TPA: CAP domain-containing protein [Candidatus Paceibacterota bacterium]|nr:CAP domain-containing protein [Candidatus Paceibacterota bacterium]